MRFILKSAFWLGMLAFLLPFGAGARSGTHVDLIAALIGAQQALEDLGGFCGRAPKACDSGGQIATFAGERVQEGFTIAYDFVGDRVATRNDASPIVPEPETAEPRATDPIRTGALPAGLPQAYRPPVRVAPAPPAAARLLPEGPARPAIPTPAPRRRAGATPDPRA